MTRPFGGTSEEAGGHRRETMDHIPEAIDLLERGGWRPWEG